MVNMFDDAFKPEKSTAVMPSTVLPETKNMFDDAFPKSDKATSLFGEKKPPKPAPQKKPGMFSDVIPSMKEIGTAAVRGEQGLASAIYGAAEAGAKMVLPEDSSIRKNISETREAIKGMSQTPELAPTEYSEFKKHPISATIAAGVQNLPQMAPFVIPVVGTAAGSAMFAGSGYTDTYENVRDAQLKAGSTPEEAHKQGHHAGLVSAAIMGAAAPILSKSQAMTAGMMRKALGSGAKDAVEVIAHLAEKPNWMNYGKQFLKGGAHTIATLAGLSAGTTATESIFSEKGGPSMEGAGRAIPAAWEAVKSSLPGAIGLVGIEGLFGLAVKPGRDRAHTDIIKALNDPSVDPKTRSGAVLHFYNGIAAKDKDSADNFALNAMRAIRDGKPVDLTSESIKPISLQGEAAPGPQPVTDWEAQDQFKAQEQGKGALSPIETAWDEFMQANGITPTSSREARDAVNRAWFESPEYQEYQKPVVPISDMPHGMNLFTGKPANEKSLNGEDPKQETPNPAAVPPAAAPAAPSAPEAAPVPPLTTEGAAEPPAGEKAVPQVQSEPTPGTKYKSIEQELGHKLSKAKERLATLEARMNNIKTPSDGLKQTLSGQHRLVEDIQKQLTDAKAARDLKTKEGDVNAEKVRIDEEKVQTGGPVGPGSEGEGSADIQQPEEVESETRDKGIKVELTPKEKIEQQEKADRVMQSIIDGTKPEHRLDAQLRSEVQKMFDEGRVEEAFDRLYKDKLTGVYNQNAWERIKDDAELKSAPVAISDLTGFKYFNDTYGHEFGDQILKAYAKSVERFGIKVYRKGGDELAMYHEGYDADALKSAMAEAKKELAETEFQATDLKTGVNKTVKGVSLDYGIDKGPEAADKAFYAVRADLQAKGQRHLKGGDRPYGLVEEEVKVAEITPEQPVHDFSSTQVNLPKAEANEILDFGKSIPDAEIYTDPNDPTVGREDKPHITVKYGIHTENAKKIKALLEGAGAVTAKLGKVDVFSPDDKPYDVVMVPVDSPELHDLNAKVAEGTKVTDTFPEYQPHVTIAYVKKGEGAKYKGDARFEGKEITFDTVHFTDKDEQATKIKLEEKPVSETKPVVPETELPKGETIEPKPGIKEPKDKTKLTVKDIPDGLKIDIWAIVEGKKVKLKGQDAKEEFTRIEAERETLDALIKCLKG